MSSIGSKFKGACFSPLPFESFGLAGREVLDLVSSLVKKASESLNIDFALLLSYWKKRISTTLQVYTAKFILEASVSKRNPQRRQDIVDSAVINVVYMVLFIHSNSKQFIYLRNVLLINLLVNYLLYLVLRCYTICVSFIYYYTYIYLLFISIISFG